jgi:hypothetical protein
MLAFTPRDQGCGWRRKVRRAYAGVELVAFEPADGAMFRKDIAYQAMM